jgi:APA family basic amino acid/polyamine antiporter
MSSAPQPRLADAAESGLKRCVGRWEVLWYGLGSMLGAGVYALMGRVAQTQGNAVWLAFVVAMLVAMLTGLVYASVGSRLARAGGAASVVHAAFERPALTYTVGLAVMMSGLTSMATGMQALAENLGRLMQWSMPSKAVALMLASLVCWVVARGIRESMRLNVLCTFVEVGGLVVIVLAGLRFWGGVNYLETPLSPVQGTALAGLDSGLVLQGAVLAFFSFIGFEDILNLGEEVRDPKRSIPFGLIGAMILAALIYVSVAITAVSVVPWRELAQSKTALVEVAQRAMPGVPHLDVAFLLVSFFAIGNTALLNALMGSRLLYGMSTQGLLPAGLGRLHPQRRTPQLAVGVMWCLVLLLIALADVRQLAEATVLLLLAVFTVVHVAAWRLDRRPQVGAEGGFRVPRWLPVLGTLACLILIVARARSAWLSPLPSEQRAPLLALGIVVVGMLLHRVFKPRRVLLEG